MPWAGGLDLLGAVKLGLRRELEAIDDPAEREHAYAAMVAAAYERGSAINMASYFEIDDVIDPADTRRWIDLLFSGDQQPPWWRQPYKRRLQIDSW